MAVPRKVIDGNKLNCVMYRPNKIWKCINYEWNICCVVAIRTFCNKSKLAYHRDLSVILCLCLYLLHNYYWRRYVPGLVLGVIKKNT